MDRNACYYDLAWGSRDHAPDFLPREPSTQAPALPAALGKRLKRRSMTRAQWKQLVRAVRQMERDCHHARFGAALAIVRRHAPGLGWWARTDYLKARQAARARLIYIRVAGTDGMWEYRSAPEMLRTLLTIKP